MIKSKIGEVIPEDIKKIISNMLEFALPIFLSTLFAQLAMGVELKQALTVSLLSFYGTLRDYFNKKNTETKYK